MNEKRLLNQWSVLTELLPKGWEEKAYELGALKRKRKIESPSQLLQVLLIHLAEGKSLRTTATYATQAGICNINDAALFNRLRVSEDWLRWLCEELIDTLSIPLPSPQISKKFNLRAVDGTIINEPGSTGTDWRIHYGIQLDSLRCDFFHVSPPKTGESLSLYPVEKKDFIIADRGYCHRKGIAHVLKNEGHVLIRFHSTSLPLFDKKKKAFDVLRELESLEYGKIFDKDVWFRDPDSPGQLIKGRLCAVKRSEESIEMVKKKLRLNASKKGNRLRAETLEYAKYVILFTTVNRHNFNSREIMELYRLRWQIELVFKRLKSLLKLGHLPKKTDASCKAWLHGKLLVALLVEKLIMEAEFFSPWGYPLKNLNQQ